MATQVARPATGGVAGHRRKQRSRALPALLGAAAGAALLATRSPGFVGGIGPRHRDWIVGGTSGGSVAREMLARAAIGDGLSDTRASAKAVLNDFLADDYLVQDMLRPEGKSTRGRLSEAIVEIEKLNPTVEPVYSDLINGEWTVKYTGTYAPGLIHSLTRELALFLYSGGFSFGNLLSSVANGILGEAVGLKVNEKVVSISGGRDVKASAQLELGGQKRLLSYEGELLPLSGRRMSEEVLRLNLPEPLGRQDVPVEVRRTILVTYLDQDTMVVRDESGVPEVLVRKRMPPPAAVITLVPNATNATTGNITQTNASSTETSQANSTTAGIPSKA